MCTCDGGIFRADVFSSIACGCSVSTVKIPVPLANLYRLQPDATDSKKAMYTSVSTVKERWPNMTSNHTTYHTSWSKSYNGLNPALPPYD